MKCVTSVGAAASLVQVGCSKGVSQLDFLISEWSDFAYWDMQILERNQAQNQISNLSTPSAYDIVMLYKTIIHAHHQHPLISQSLECPTYSDWSFLFARHVTLQT